MVEISPLRLKAIKAQQSSFFKRVFVFLSCSTPSEMAYNTKETSESCLCSWIS